MPYSSDINDIDTRYICNAVINELNENRCFESHNNDNRLLQSILEHATPDTSEEFNSTVLRKGKLVRKLWQEAQENIDNGVRCVRKTKRNNYVNDNHDNGDNISWGMNYKKNYQLPTISSMVKAKHPLFVQYRKPQQNTKNRYSIRFNISLDENMYDSDSYCSELSNDNTSSPGFYN